VLAAPLPAALAALARWKSPDPNRPGTPREAPRFSVCNGFVSVGHAAMREGAFSAAPARRLPPLDIHAPTRAAPYPWQRAASAGEAPAAPGP